MDFEPNTQQSLRLCRKVEMDIGKPKKVHTNVPRPIPVVIPQVKPEVKPEAVPTEEPIAIPVPNWPVAVPEPVVMPAVPAVPATPAGK